MAAVLTVGAGVFSILEGVCGGVGSRGCVHVGGEFSVVAADDVVLRSPVRCVSFTCDEDCIVELYLQYGQEG